MMCTISIIMVHAEKKSGKTSCLNNNCCCCCYDPTINNNNNKQKQKNQLQRRPQLFNRNQQRQRRIGIIKNNNFKHHSTKMRSASSLSLSSIPIILTTLSLIITIMGHYTNNDKMVIFVSSMMLLRPLPPPSSSSYCGIPFGRWKHSKPCCNHNHHYTHGKQQQRGVAVTTTTRLSLHSPAHKYLNNLSDDDEGGLSKNDNDVVVNGVPSSATKDNNTLNDNDGDNDGNVEHATIIDAQDDEYDDDDYANSIPMPVVRQLEEDVGGSSSLDDDDEEDCSSSLDDYEDSNCFITSEGRASGSESNKTLTSPDEATDESSMGEDEASAAIVLHPNEEPPLEDEENITMASNATMIYDDAVKNSKFEILLNKKENVVENESFSFDVSTSTTSATNPTTITNKGSSIKSRFQKLLRVNKDDKSRTEERERARKWSEWMSSGRKVRSGSGSSGGEVSEDSSSDGEAAKSDNVAVVMDESLLSIDKGADYVVVAVPAEAVPNGEGVLPILSSFPGGKLFQKTIGKTFQDVIVNTGAAANIIANSTTGGSVNSTLAFSMNKKQKTKKKSNKKLPTPPPTTKPKNQQKKEEDIELKQRRRQEKHFREAKRVREPGRVSANDWRHNIVNLPSSTILRDVQYPVACVFVWATLWSVLHWWLRKLGGGVVTSSVASLAQSSARSSSWWVTTAAPWFARHMCLPASQHSMMVSAMSLLLVFRTNSAYQRFAEGRKIWNDIVDTTRDFSRMIKLYEFAIGTSKCRRINSLLASFPYLLRHRIRPSLMTFYRVNDLNVERDPENSLLLYPDESLRDTDPEVAELAYDQEEKGSSRRKTRELCWVDKRTLPWKMIPGSALELCARAQNRPLWVCDRMAKELAVVEDLLPTFTNRERLALIGYVDKLSRSIGACERIHQTVVPLNYARHALRSLTVWLWTLPFALVKDLGLLTGPVVAVVSWILFGVYEIGSRIEDPFQGTLRLSIYCDAIRRDVLADAIARDTAFELEEEVKPSSADDDDDYREYEDSILESESEEGDGDSAKKKKGVVFLGNLFP